MITSYVYYALQDGLINNWLVYGPQVIPVEDCKQYTGSADLNLQIARHYHKKGTGIRKQLVERGPLNGGVSTIGEFQGNRNYYRCSEAHFPDQPGTYPVYYYLRGSAYPRANVAAHARQPGVERLRLGGR